MSRYPNSSRRFVGLSTLVGAALSLLACAHAVDDGTPDTLDTSSAPTAGSASSGGAAEPGGSSSAGLGDVNSGGDSPNQAPGGGFDDGGAPGSAGQSTSAGAGDTTAAGGSNDTGNAGRGGSSAGGSNPGNGGSVATAGSAGGHACKVTTDLNVYTLGNTGCGGYATCKGQIHWHNEEAQALTKIVLSFSEPPGTSCITDNSSSKWTITDNGATSHRCVFTASGAAWSVDSKSALSFGYDTTQTGTSAPTDITVSDPSCN